METGGRPFYKFHDFHLVDANGRPSGTVDWIWTSEVDGGVFLGVDLRWLRGVARAVPAYGARIDTQARTIRVLSTREQIATARRFAINRALRAADTQAIGAHYARDTASAAHPQSSAVIA